MTYTRTVYVVIFAMTIYTGTFIFSKGYGVGSLVPYNSKFFVHRSHIFETVHPQCEFGNNGSRFLKEIQTHVLVQTHLSGPRIVNQITF